MQSSISAKPRAKFEIQDKSVLILRSEHPFGTSLAELGTELWHVMCQGITASHSVCEQCISLGFLGSWITQEAQTLTSITYIFKLMFFYSFLTPGTQWVRDLILWHHKDFQARSRVCQGIYYSARANMLMSLWQNPGLISRQQEFKRIPKETLSSNREINFLPAGFATTDPLKSCAQRAWSEIQCEIIINHLIVIIQAEK